MNPFFSYTCHHFFCLFSKWMTRLQRYVMLPLRLWGWPWRLWERKLWILSLLTWINSNRTRYDQDVFIQFHSVELLTIVFFDRSRSVRIKLSYLGGGRVQQEGLVVVEEGGTRSHHLKLLLLLKLHPNPLPHLRSPRLLQARWTARKLWFSWLNNAEYSSVVYLCSQQQVCRRKANKHLRLLGNLRRPLTVKKWQRLNCL